MYRLFEDHVSSFVMLLYVWISSSLKKPGSGDHRNESSPRNIFLVFGDVTFFVILHRILEWNIEIWRVWKDHLFQESSAFIRKKTIEIFTSIVTCIDAYKQPEKMHHKLKPVIAMFCAKFPESLRMENDVTNYEAGLTVTIHIVETIRQLIKKFPKSIFTFLPKILPVTWEILSHGAKFHRDRALNVKKGKTHSIRWHNDLWNLYQFIKGVFVTERARLFKSNFLLLQKRYPHVWFVLYPSSSEQ